MARSSNGSLPAPCLGDRPGEPRRCVTVRSRAYARWRGGRLPTEAEWGDTRPRAVQRYPWGDAFHAAITNVVESEGPVPVGSYPGRGGWARSTCRGTRWSGFQLVGRRLPRARPGVSPAGPASGKIRSKGGWWGGCPSSPDAPTGTTRTRQYGDKHIGGRMV